MDVRGRRNRFWVQAEPVESKVPGVWPTAIVRVYDGDHHIGSYERNLAGWAEATFEPFGWDGEWYALYAPDYTSTRVMSLPDCRDLGGEEHASDGFCPVEYYVPRYREQRTRNRVSGHEFTGWRFSSEIDEPAGPEYEVEFGQWTTIPTGFVAGCQWGDDKTWKLECIDLASAAQGQIVRTARFGHVELVAGKSLADSLELDRHPPFWDLRATLIRQERRDVATGVLIDPYDE
jgi:hypothetical protein